MSRSNGPPRRRPIVVIASLLVAAAIVAAIALFRTQAAGEGSSSTSTPVATATSVAVTSTPTAAATPSPTPSPTPIPAALAQQAVENYWTDIASGKYGAAYALLSNRSQQNESADTFKRALAALVASGHGITPQIGTAVVSGLHATVPVTLLPANSTSPTKLTQRLLWESDAWHVDAFGGS